MKINKFWTLAFVLVITLLPISSFAQTKQSKANSKPKISIKKKNNSSGKEISQTPKVLVEEKAEEKPNQIANTPSSAEASITPTTTPKKKTLDNSDIEAYGLAQEVKPSVENKAQSSQEPNSNNTKPSGSGRRGRYGFNVPSSPTPK